MKALTICQPYAELIMRGEKRVENRKWWTAYRGPLLIHAGKSREWLDLDLDEQEDESYGIPLAEMDFGAIVGVVQLRGCVSCKPIIVEAQNTRDGLPRRIGKHFDPLVLEAWPWLASHEHAEGPCCWILEDAFRFSRPVPYRGQQALFDVAAGIVAAGLSEAMEARRAQRCT